MAGAHLMAADPAVRVSVPAAWGEVAGALLMESLGPFQEWEGAGAVHLLFYPFRHGAGFVPDEVIRSALPPDPGLQSVVEIERVLVPSGWEEGWKEHFKPLVVGDLYVRPPWEPPASAVPPYDVCLTPGLAFGTGLHPTTRGVLELMQDPPVGGGVVDAGTGSGILAVAAARLGYEPVRAFDNDPLAVEAARSNAAANGVEPEVRLADVVSAPAAWFAGATVLANMTLEPARGLLARLAAERIAVVRVLVAGILAGDQEEEVTRAAAAAGLTVVRTIHEGEWVSFDLRPVEEG